MGITPPSPYGAFGDKRALLLAAALGDSRDDAPPGCLLASSIVSSSSGADPIRERLADIRRGIEAALRARIQRDIDSRALPAHTDADMLAGHVFAVVQGMSTMAKDGAGRDKLLKIAEAAMAGWPHNA